MKLGITGSRTISDKDLIYKNLDAIDGIEVIIHGGAKGADTLAGRYAKDHDIPVIIHDPDYKTHGRVAPFVRNRQIVDEADEVIAFHDGKSRGTKYTAEYADYKNKLRAIVYATN